MNYRFGIINPDNHHNGIRGIAASFGFDCDDTFLVVNWIGNPYAPERYRYWAPNFGPVWTDRASFLRHAHEHLRGTEYEAQLAAWILGS
jgi:hypothetical protein